MYTPIRLKGLAGSTLLLSFVLLVTVLVASAIVLALNLRGLVRDFEWVQHSGEVLTTTNQTIADLNAVESAGRGYVNSGFPDFEAAYRDRKKAVAFDLGSLYTLTLDNPEQLKRLRSLPPLLAARYRGLEAGMARRTAGLPQVNDPAAYRTNMAIRSRLYSTLAEFKSSEEGLSRTRVAANRRSEGAAAASFWVMTLIASFGLVGFYGMVARTIRAEVSRAIELESQVTQRTSELVAANRDLESFSYSVSHDLRAPLRAVGSFAQILQEDAKGALTDENNETLDRIVDGCHRMSHLIDALLNLSRVSRSDLVLSPVDLSELASKVFREVTADEPPGRVELRVEPGARVQGDPALLRVLLTNLAGNALKFSRKADPPRIRFRHLDRKDEAIYFVEDNGVGFDSGRAEDLFEPFHRYHSADEYPGTGIGLAICARIVGRHGGRLWAVSEPGQGARFFFTLGPAGRPDANHTYGTESVSAVGSDL